MKLRDPILFREGRAVSRLDLPSTGDPGALVDAHVGHFAVHQSFGDGGHLLVRDLLGVHKLFFALEDGVLESSNYLVDLLRAGHAFEHVYSVPAGHYVRVHPARDTYALGRWGQVQFGGERAVPAAQGSLTPFAHPIRAALVRTFRMLARHFAGRPIYVSLSGGLDSTMIAALAREHFEKLTAVTFALQDPREAGPGSDLFFARRVAADLGLEHVEVLAQREDVLALLDEVLLYGQDYRDFNVQCGLVNAAIGKAIGALHPAGPRPVVLSGDAMNELMADYTPVEFRGREYFGLPRIDRGRIRRFLVGGLDSGDREVGIFARFGVESVQPYALCAREYAALPADLTVQPGFKSQLARCLLDGGVPEYVLARCKVRAQTAVEGVPAGTLALLVDRGIDQTQLESRFARLIGIDRRAAVDLTRAGHYRFSTDPRQVTTSVSRA
ncbi:MAG TPA: asparagine synthase-related protein [Planctomycetota bacterium]|nr:asparagine synthase-related protein [Planctomycetota bacterium]